eukprot:m.293223 g.293223  ORF g.293223 m.293223 type:complete len:266 (-) comp12749_c0_seq1:181-978(-)
MATDIEVARSVWGGRIPLALSLASADQSLDQSTGTYYLLAPRGVYLSMCNAKISAHFGRPEDAEVWYEVDGRPLKWNMPVGVLYDVFNTDGTLPWAVTVHFQDYPSTLLPCPNLSATESFFLNAVKEAAFIKHGTSQIDGLQSQKEKKQLWLGLFNDDFEQFRRTASKLNRCREGHWFKNIPFRALIVSNGDPANSLHYVEQPFPATIEGAPATLGDLVQFATGSATVSKAVIHGLEPAFSTPLQWLSEYCAHPDNFLYIVLHVE